MPRHAHWLNMTASDRDIMVALAKLDQPSGQAVKRQLSEDGREDVSDALVYPGLDRLEERGLVHQQEDPRDPRCHVYALTDAGARLLEQHTEVLQEASADVSTVTLDNQVPTRLDRSEFRTD